MVGQGRLTVGICAYNEEANIGNLLKALLSQSSRLGELEVVVVCSGCTDRTCEIVGDYAAKDSRVVLVVEGSRRGKPSALNKILSKALGDRILLISADVIPAEGCVEKLVGALDRDGVGMACGRPVPVNCPKGLVDRLVRSLWSLHHYQLSRLSEDGRLAHAGEVLCIRKGIVHRVPAEVINDDAYMAAVARLKGFKVEYVPDAIALMAGPRNVPDYVRQRRRIVAGHYQLRLTAGLSSQYFVFRLMLDPLGTLRTLVSWLASSEGVIVAPVLALLELFVNFLALLDHLSGRAKAIWPIAQSTKRISLDEGPLQKTVPAVSPN